MPREGDRIRVEFDDGTYVLGTYVGVETTKRGNHYVNVTDHAKYGPEGDHHDWWGRRKSGELRRVQGLALAYVTGVEII